MKGMQQSCGKTRGVVVADHFVAVLSILAAENDVTYWQPFTHINESVSPQSDQTYATHNPNYRDKRRAYGSSQRVLWSLTNHCCHLFSVGSRFGLWMVWTESMEPSDVTDKKL